MWRAPIDACLQKKIAPQSLWRRILKMTFQPPLRGHSGQCCIFDTMRSDSFGQNLAANVHRTASNCHFCVGNDNVVKHKRHLRLFSTAEPLEFVAVNICGTLSRTTKGCKNLVMITDQYSKLTLVVSTCNIAMTASACIFLNTWVVPYDITSYILSDSSKIFVSKLFGTLCIHLKTKLLVMTTYRQQTSGLVEGYNETILARLRY